MEALKRGYASMAALPLLDGSAVIGSLNIYSDKADAFDAEEVRLLTELAADLSFGMRHLRLQRELEASEIKFKGLADNALMGIIQTTFDGEILYANGALLKMFEFDSIGEFISGGALQRWKNPEERKKMVETLKSSGRAVIEVEMLTRTGKTITVLFSAVVAGDNISSTVMDVTERKAMENELIASRKTLLTAQELAHLGNWEMDVESGKTKWSDELYRIFDFEPGAFEPAFDKFMGLVHPEDRTEMEECISGILAGKHRQAELDRRIIRPDGGERIIHNKVEVIPDKDGKPVRIIGINFDITERKMYERKLEIANEDLKTAMANMEKANAFLLRQEKLASIGTLSAGVAHEILNPLNIIGTIVQLMQMDEWPKATKGHLDDIMTQVKRATKITNNLRMFAHVHKREITAVDVHALFDKTATLLEHDFNLDNIMIDRDYGENFPAVQADQDLLAQVFLNLLNNARQALQEKKDGGNKLITVKTRAIDDRLEISLSNNGPRIPEEIIGKIFDPFFTTKDPNKGTGLGLSMANTFIQDFGGTITVKNDAPEGVTFTITLPVAEGKGGQG